MQKDEVYNSIKRHSFMVRVTAMFMLSEQQIRMEGVYLNGGQDVNASQGLELITTYLSIDKIVSRFAEGATVAIVSRSDIPVIYDFITDYLQYWKNELETAINISSPPIDELINYDEFADNIFKYAVSEKDSDPTLKQFINKYTRAIPNVQSGIFTTIAWNSAHAINSPNGNVVEEQQITRYSFGEFLRQKAMDFQQRSNIGGYGYNHNYRSN